MQGILLAVFIGLFLSTGVFVFLQPTNAASFEDLGTTLGLGSKDLKETIITFVQWALGILSLVVVVILIYGGFVWMTAAGNEEKVAKAKRIIRNGIIGLVIVLISWAIVWFVVNAISNSTGGGGPVACTPGQVNGCFTCDNSNNWVWNGMCGFPGPQYYVQSKDPASAATNVFLCAAVQAAFGGLATAPPNNDQNDLDGTTVNATNVVIQKRAGAAVAGSFGTNANAFSFTHPADLDVNSIYDVTVTSNVKSKYGTGSRPETWSFTTGTTSDPDPPNVTSWYPRGNQVCLSPAISATFNESMLLISMKLSNITLSPADAQIVNLSVTPTQFIAYTDQPLKPNTTYTITLSADTTNGFRDACNNALDCGGPNPANQCNFDGVSAGSPADNFVWTFTTKNTVDPSCEPQISSVAPSSGYYTNAAADEITINGSNFGPSDRVQFTPGYSATVQNGTNSLCFSNVPPPNNFKPQQVSSVACISSWQDDQIKVKTPAGPLGSPPTGASDGPVVVKVGVKQSNASSPYTVASPHINYTAPQSGGPGQYVTVVGKNFGNTVGEVWFRRDDGTEFKGDAPPASCGAQTWTDTQIIIKVPSGFTVNDLTRVQVKNVSIGGTTGKDRSNLTDFTITNVVGPGLCSLSLACVNDPSANVAITMNGERFGVSRGSSGANFIKLTPPNTNYQPGSYTGWNDTLVSTFVPTGLPQDSFHVSVTVNGTASNPLNFQVPCGGIPQVLNDQSCTPASGLPSPSPAPSDTPNACRNAVIRVLFSTDMDDTTVSGASGASNYELKSCDTKLAFATFNDANCTTPVAINNPSLQAYTNPSRDGVTIQPQPLMLDQNTWYRVTVNQTVKSAAGVTMAQNFVWHFLTQDTPDPCNLDSISVTPQNQTRGYPLVNDPYTATALAPQCQVINPAAFTWAWSSSVPTVADISSQSVNTAQVSTGAVPTEGTTQIRAAAGGKTGSGDLTITLNYCQKNSDCSNGGLCPNSTCDLTAQRCKPSVNSIAPASGPVGTFTTISGCYFGATKGANGKVELEKSGGPTIEANYVCSTGGWTDTQITVAAPAGFANSDVTSPIVTTDGLLNNRGQTGMPSFTYSGQCCANANCTAFTAVPASGPPGLCVISPNFQSQGGAVTLTGKNFPTGNALDQVEFGGPTTASGPFASSTQIITNVPAGAASGNVYVKAWNGSAYCYSNPQTLTIACRTPGLGTECLAAGNTCCTGNPLSCQVDANCNVGVPGDQCRIPGYVPCSTGAGVVTDPNNYNCVSDNGYTGNPPPAAGGLDCRVCCTPNQRASVPPLASGLTCVVNQPAAITTCTGSARGLYCGCTSDSQCGSPATTGCGDTGARCCSNRPVVTSVTPVNGSINVCRNASVTIRFSIPMRSQSFTASDPAAGFDTVKVLDGVTPVPILVQAFPQEVVISRKDANGLWDTSKPYTISVTGDSNTADGVAEGVLSNDGIGMNGNATSSFTIGTTICKVDHLEATITPAGPSPTLNLYTCAGDSCLGDTSVRPGNNHLVEIRPVDAAGVTLRRCDFTRTYTENLGGDVVTVEEARSMPPFGGVCVAISLCPDGSNPCDTWKYYNSQNQNGTEVVRSSFNGVNPSYGSASIDVTNRVFLCEKPWPDPRAVPPQTFPFTDNDYHFSLKYCRDNGNLPRLDLPAVVNTPAGVVAGNNLDQLLQEYFFFVGDYDAGGVFQRTGDAVGVRVMENELRLSPSKWYQRQFGRAPSAAVTKVDGYEAFTEGRTTYVAGTNLANNGTLYTQIFLLSYNDGAKPETQAIVGELLKYWFLNTNLSPNNKLAVTYDTKRLADLRDLAFSLVDSRKANGDYPKLSGGSYLERISTSAWPSWNQTLGTALRTPPPLDVHENKFTPGALCKSADGFDQNTCWNEAKKEFQCPAGSHVYQYKYEGASAAALFANLEYTGAGAWTNYSGNPCSGYPGSTTCACYNFRWPDDDFEALVSNFAQAASTDTAKPTVANLRTSPASPVSGTVLVSVDASDNVGVDRVEFYLDTALQFTDRTNSYEWSWDSTRTPNGGGHQIAAKAYDRAGNSEQVSINVTVNNPLSDTTPPTVSITAPANVSANSVAITANALDNAGGLGMKEVAFYVNSTLIGTAAAPGPYTVSWDTRSYANGSYTLIAVAFDKAGNSAASRITVTLNHSAAADRTPPIVSFTNPSAGSTVFGTVTVTVSASDPESPNPSVDFFIDGVQVLPRILGAPYQWVWDTTTSADGNHTIRAVATNIVGLTASTGDITVTVRNGGAGEPIPPTAPTRPIVTDDGQFQTSTNTLHANWSSGDPESGISQYEYAIATCSPLTVACVPNVVNWKTSLTQTSVTQNFATPLTNGVTYFFHVRSTNGVGLVSTIGSSDGITVDNTLPAVSITAPAAGTVSGNVSISAFATDGGSGVAQVQFIVDLTVIGTGTSTSPGTWIISWDTSSVTNGSHTLRAIATDALGNSATSVGVSVDVNNVVAPPPDTTPPTVSISPPTPNVVGGSTFVKGTVNVTATASDNVGVTAVRFFVQFIANVGVVSVTQIGADDTTAPYGVTWNTVGLDESKVYTLIAVALDAAGNGGTAQVGNIRVDNSAPASVNLSISANPMQTNTNATVTATVSDGTGSGVARVECYENNAIFYTSQTPPNFTCTYSPTLAGTYAITAKAWDALGNGPTPSPPLSVTVSDCIPLCGGATPQCCNGICRSASFLCPLAI